jgi:hypothetical protein
MDQDSYVSEVTVGREPNHSNITIALRSMVAVKNAELSFPQKHILRITIGKKSLDVSFLPEQPITTATMLRKAMVIFE